MADQIRFYQGAGFETFALSPERALSIGKAESCDLVLLPEMPGDPHGQLLMKGGRWVLVYEGKQLALEAGVFVPLDKKLKVALELVRGDAQSEAVDLRAAEEWNIGRNGDCGIVLAHKRVSGNHARLIRRGKAWFFVDLGSTDGSYVNGERTREAALREGDEIVIGPYTLAYARDTLIVSGGEVRVQRREKPKRKAARQLTFSRSPRIALPVPQGEIEIDPAPGLGGKPEINWLTTLLPVTGMLIISVAMMAVTGSFGMMLSIPMMLIGVVVTVINYRTQTKKFETAESELSSRYHAYLAEKEARLQEAARLQKEAACADNPPPEQCLDMARRADSRLFERTPQDEDFLAVRVGVGAEPLRMQVRTQRTGFSMQESELTAAARDLAQRYQTVESVPVLCALRDTPMLGIVGERVQAVSVAQTMLVQLCTLHGCDDVRVAVLYGEREQAQWAWTRWLPQTWNDERTRRFVACGRYEAEELFGAVQGMLKQRAEIRQDGWGQAVPQPHWVFVVADMRLVPEHAAAYLAKGVPGVTCIVLGAGISALPSGVRVIVQVAGRDSELYEKSNPAQRRRFAMDQLPVAACDAFARALAPIRLRMDSAEGQLPRMITLLDGYRVSDPSELEIGENWESACSYKSLAAPIGMGAGGLYFFDIHEKHSGPHGLVAGTNGSGKSEMAQSYIVSMALQFSPEDVNFVLVDFKGTSLLRPLLGLPHLAGSISNLDEDISRCLAGLGYEIERRERLVHELGVKDILEYQAMRASRPELEPMPFLILVIDEYADFKANFPEFTGELEHISRGGRALGLYTLIMTQKPAGVVTEQMYSNALFRWCLRVASESDSREMLGVGSAAHIDTPGRCFVRLGSGEIDAVQPFYSGAPYRPGRGKQEEPPTIACVQRSGKRQCVTPEANADGASCTQLEAVVKAISAYSSAHRIGDARKLWLPPLPDREELIRLLPQAKAWKELGDWQSSAQQFAAVIGRVDNPAKQEQYTLRHDFLRDGNLLVYGMPLSGKTTLLSTVAISLCSVYAPDQVQLYIMEFGGYALRALDRFPHVGGAAGDDEPEVLARIVAAFGEELKRRKQLFRESGAGSFAAYRQAHSLPAWVLLVDNLSQCCAGFFDLTEELVRIASDGMAFGLYLAACTTGTTGLNYKLAQSFSTTLTLQLNDSSDYAMIVGRVRKGAPHRAIGRGFVRGPLEFQTAIFAARANDHERADVVKQMAKQMREEWSGALPRRIASVPQRVPYGTVPGGPLAIGLDCAEASPVCLPLGKTVGFMVSASDAQSKAHARRLLLRQLAGIPGLALVTNEADAPDGATRVEGPDALNAALLELVPVMRERQSAYRAGRGGAFPPIVILIDDAVALLRSGPDEMISRLEVFVRLGEGLNVTVILLDLAAALSSLYYSGDILTETLHAHPLLLAGGDAQTHTIADVSAVARLAPGVLERGDWVLVQNGHMTAVRPMESEGEG